MENKSIIKNLVSSNLRILVQINDQSYIDWLDGGEYYNKFDILAYLFLGKMVYNEYQQLARLHDKLLYDLGLLKVHMSGGIDLRSTHYIDKTNIAYICKGRSGWFITIKDPFNYLNKNAEWVEVFDKNCVWDSFPEAEEFLKNIKEN